MAKVKRTEQIRVKPDETLGNLCHLSKNLYNEAMKKSSGNYRELPSQTSQQVLRLLDKSWKSFFQAMKGWKENPDDFLGRPELPNYKRKDGEHLVVFTNQQCRLREDYLHFPKKAGLEAIKTRLTEHTDLREVRVIPKGVGYVVEIVYKKEVDKKELNKERIAGIDLGAKNIVTMANNIGATPIIVKDDGRGVKSIQQFYNKVKGKIQSFYSRQDIKDGKRLRQLRAKRDRKAHDYTHKLSRGIVKWCKENDIGVLVLGYNPEWKQKANMGRRKSRGLFRTARGEVINADVNGALNIIRKAIPDAFTRGRYGGRIGGCGRHPASLSADEMLEITRS